MYNEDLKRQFISSYTSSEKTAAMYVSIFNYFEKYEETWGADLCTRPIEDLQPAIDNISGVREQSKITKLAALRVYVKWCINNGIDNACDAMFKITVIGLQKLKEQTVANPRHFQTYLDNVFDKESDDSVDNIYRSYYWLAYAGMSDDDIVRVKCSDVDFENQVVKFEGKEYPLYKEAYPALRRAVEAEGFLHHHPNFRLVKAVFKPRAKGDTLIRNLSEIPMTPHLISNSLSKYTKRAADAGYSAIRMNYYRAWISGVFFRMREFELSGGKVDFKWVVMELQNYKSKCTNKNDPKRIKQLSESYKSDYERWKLIYS